MNEEIKKRINDKQILLRETLICVGCIILINYMRTDNKNIIWFNRLGIILMCFIGVMYIVIFSLRLSLIYGKEEQKE